jgi:hypothetical protein
MRWIGFRVTRARRGGNAGGQGRGEAGNFCRHGINCRDRGASPRPENPYFIGFLALARRLLILLPSM